MHFSFLSLHQRVPPLPVSVSPPFLSICLSTVKNKICVHMHMCVKWRDQMCLWRLTAQPDKDIVMCTYSICVFLYKRDSLNTWAWFIGSSNQTLLPVMPSFPLKPIKESVLCVEINDWADESETLSTCFNLLLIAKSTFNSTQPHLLSAECVSACLLSCVGMSACTFDFLSWFAHFSACS